MVITNGNDISYRYRSRCRRHPGEGFPPKRRVSSRHMEFLLIYLALEIRPGRQISGTCMFWMGPIGKITELTIRATFRSSPAYESPLRHHRRKPSTPRQVKETLHARSEYTNSEDDGTSIHRINQYCIKQEIGRGSFGAVHLAVDQHGNKYVRACASEWSCKIRCRIDDFYASLGWLAFWC